MQNILNISSQYSILVAIVCHSYYPSIAAENSRIVNHSRIPTNGASFAILWEDLSANPRFNHSTLPATPCSDSCPSSTWPSGCPRYLCHQKTRQWREDSLKPVSVARGRSMTYCTCLPQVAGNSVPSFSVGSPLSGSHIACCKWPPRI